MKISTSVLRSTGRFLTLALALGLLWASLPQVPAQAATVTLFLRSDGVPVAGLSTALPTATSLANYDPGRDGEPGLVLEPTVWSGLEETNPAKYQQWSAPKGGVALDGPLTFRFWSAPAGFGNDSLGEVRVGVHDCNQPETHCNLIAYDTLTRDAWSPTGDWTQHTIHWSSVQYDVPNGHHLMVKLVVGAASETPLLFAYDTVDYQSRLEIDVAASNAPPAAGDDAAATNEDIPVTIDLLGNDSDPEEDPLSLLSIEAPAGGSIVDHEDGSVTYRPDPDWHGVDTFTYTVTDGADTASAGVTVTVAPVNDPPVAVDDTTTTLEDTSIGVDVVANDSDVDGDHLVVSQISQPGNGTAEVTGEHTIAFHPPSDWSGTATIGYEVSDGSVAIPAILIIDVDPVNDAPTAVDDAATVPEDGTVTVDLLGNDTDIDSGSLTLLNVSTPGRGSATPNGGGSVTYTPNPDFSGSDSFEYTIGDGTDSATATVTIDVTPVNDAPAASDLSFSLLEDTSISFDPIADATDIDGDALFLVTVSNPANGTAAVDPAGAIVVELTPDWNGNTTFEYTLSDGAELATAEVQLTVAPVNDVPVAAADEATTAEDHSVLVDVLANDLDVDGDSLVLTSVVAGGAGSATIEGRSIRYTPAADWTGSDLLTYAISDGAARAVGVIRVTVTPVNDPPAAGHDAATIIEDATAYLEVLSNDTDPDGDALVIAAVGDPSFGTAILAGERIVYTPYPDAFGTDTFTYTAQDPSGSTTVGTVVVVTLAVNDLPTAGDDSAETVEDAAVRINVLANDGDVDGDELALGIEVSPDHGAVSMAEDGTITYTPETNWHGVAGFSYAVSDAAGSATAVVTVTVDPVNDAPVATADQLEVDEGGRVTFDPTENDADVDGDSLAVTAWVQPLHGRVSAVAGGLTYRPDPDYWGPDSFSYTAADGHGGFSAAAVTVTVRGVADPVAADEPAPAALSGPEIVIDITSDGFEPGTHEVDVVTVTQGQFGTVTPNEDGTLSFVPTERFSGHDSFGYVITDGEVVQAAEVTVSLEQGGVALIEISMTPASVSAAQWLPVAEPSAVVAGEAAETVARLAAPAAIAAAAAGATLVSQSQTAMRILVRLGQLLRGRF